MSKESYYSYGREILELEAQAILNLRENLDGQFDRAVELLIHVPPQGRVVLSGMGKAGFIAQKISATLASTGIPSFFLHPAEALHGDLGRFVQHDLALILSNSGETQEVLRMLGPIKRVGCPIISLTARADSSLARHSDVTLTIGAHKEAGPLQLAPTTSTTVMLALGDALAMAVLKARNLSKEQFAFFHPSGELGRSLMLVSEVMRRGEENCIVPSTMLTREVIAALARARGRPGAASVVDAKGALVGVFTNGDIRRQLEKGSSFLEWPIERVMTRSPKVIEDTKLVQEALRILREFQIDELPVVNAAGAPVGMIDIQDLVDLRARV